MLAALVDQLTKIALALLRIFIVRKARQIFIKLCEVEI